MAHPRGLLDTSAVVLLSRLSSDADAARAFGRVAASLRWSGRTTVARSYDAMIAAIALVHGLPVYTANPDDFAHIEGLTVVAVPIALEPVES